MGPEIEYFETSSHVRPKFQGYKDFVETLDEPTVTVQEKRTQFVAVSFAGRETRIELTFEAMTLMFVC